jgi:hypothetical protein
MSIMQPDCQNCPNSGSRPIKQTLALLPKVAIMTDPGLCIAGRSSASIAIATLLQELNIPENRVTNILSLQCHSGSENASIKALRA